MRRSILAITTLVLVSLSSNATEVTGKVIKVWAQVADQYDTIAVQLDVPAVNPQSTCSHSGWYRLNSSNAGYKTAVSVLLSAQAAGQTVNLTLNGCDSYPRFTNVILQ